MKPLASLSSTLLARKGQARPAMRNQAYALTPAPAASEDLGWNDMGAESTLTPTPPPPPPPPVLTERAVLREMVEVPPVAKPEPRPVSPATAARIGRDSAAQTKTGKAAFTLRLDADRHLRLRLASAVSHRSAQALVADALDRLLATMPDVEALVSQLPDPATTPRRPSHRARRKTAGTPS